MLFPTTQWSQLAIASLDGDTSARTALGEFYTNYREPVHRVILARGVSDPEAEDLTQEFLLHLMEKSGLRRADRNRGRFRSFLQGALTHFLSDVADRRNAAKRGGRAQHLHLDSWLAGRDGEPHLASEAELLLFDREWALAIMNQAMRSMDCEAVAAGTTAAYAVLKRFLPVGATPISRQQAAAEAGMSEPAFAAELHRLRRRLRAAIREQVAATVSAPHEIDAEMRHLMTVLMSPALDLAHGLHQADKNS